MHHTIGLVGFGGELLRALARAGRRSRTLAELVLIAMFVCAPSSTFVGDQWATPESSFLLPADPPIHVRVAALVTPEEPVARAAPEARGAVVVAPPPPAPAPTRAPAPQPPPAAAPAGPLSGGAWVYASWYGPGFYGNRTACGLTFTPSSWGVAHRTLRCGTMVQITYRGHTVSAPVIDRGPYVAGREIDLAAAVANALGFSGVQQVYLVIP